MHHYRGIIVLIQRVSFGSAKLLDTFGFVRSRDSGIVLQLNWL